MGDEWPSGSDVFQMRLELGPKDSGSPAVSAIPEPFGPRKRGQSPADAQAANARMNPTGRVSEIRLLLYVPFFGSGTTVTLFASMVIF